MIMRKKEIKDINKGDCMNRKLILAAIAVALTASCAQATNITGVTGNNGVYNITPEHYSGNAAYRKYDNFTLSQGDVANLDFVDRTGKPTNAFINLVQNGVNISGALNTVKNNQFYNGHAIFITPGGFVVGSSGVLNVGRLSVATPTAEKYNKLLKDSANQNYGDANFHYEEIGGQVSALTQNSKGTAGAANITINGLVFTNKGAEMAGSTVSVPGHIVNGVKNQTTLTSEETATELFNSLVNTNGSVKDSSKFEVNGSRILVKSTGSMDMSGSLTNGAVAANNTNSKVGTFLTNTGSGGMSISGKVHDNSLVRAYNTAGKLEINNGAILKGKNVIAQSKGTNLNIKNGATLNATTKAQVVNNGSGNLALDEGSTVKGSKVEIINDGTGSLTTSGTLTAAGELAIRNNGSSMTIAGTAKNTSGETAIRNKKGDATISATIENNGNMGIINEGGSLEFTSDSEITNSGKLKIASTQDASGNMTINNNIDNTGEIRIYNDHGKLSFGVSSNVSNENGNLYVVSRKQGTGISQAESASFTNKNGNIVIRNSGQASPTASNTYGMELLGSVNNTNGTVAINNDFGNMKVSDNITVNKGNLGIINRGNGKVMTAGGKLTVTNGNVNIKNFGNGNMSVTSEISHDGRVNVLANSGKLTLGSKVTNNSGALGENGGFYAAARANGTGVKVTSAFTVNGNGEVVIKNISGNNGLEYEGTVNTTNHQAVLVNKKGEMSVSGSLTTTNAPIIISNQGQKLTVSDSTSLNSGIKGYLVNTGSENASFSQNATLNNVDTREQLNYTGK